MTPSSTPNKKKKKLRGCPRCDTKPNPVLTLNFSEEDNCSVVVNELDSDIVVNSNFTLTVIYTFGLKTLRKLRKYLSFFLLAMD